MPFCVSCGKELKENDKFCSACGKENTEYIPNNGYKTSEFDITITPKIRLYGPKDAKTEIDLYIPQLGRNMYFRFPNFFEFGQTLRVRGEGAMKPNGEKGDLLVTPIEVEYYDTELTISAYLVGPKESVTKMPLYLPHKGKSVQISVPNNLTVGKTLRLKGLGLAAPNGEQGDLYLHFDHIEFTQEVEAPLKSEKKEDSSKQKQEYVGKIKKCPACGDEIPALTAICPACGHELNSARVLAVLKEFIDDINECDRRIANAPHPPKTGWASWSKAKRVWWIILNIFTSFVPLVIYLLMPLLRYNSTPRLTADEKQKASLIENFPFPNDRESILEALLFAKSKVAFLAAEKVDQKTAYWTRLWSTKAEQLYEKAEIMFKGDTVASEAIKEIVVQKERVSKTVKFRAVVGVVILVVAIVFIGIRNGAFEIDTTDYNSTFEWQTNDLFTYLPQPAANFGRIVKESEKEIDVELYQIDQDQFDAYVKACREKGFSIDVTKTDRTFYADNAEGLALSISYHGDTKVMDVRLDAYSIEETTSAPPTTETRTVVKFEEGTYRDVDVEEYTFSIPNYWAENGSKEEYLQYYAETDGKVAMLSIGYPVDEKDKVSLELLVNDNEKMIKAIESMYKNCKVIEYQKFSSDYGVNGIVYDFSFTYRELLSKYDMNGKFFCFPSPEDNRWFYVIIGVTDNTDMNSADYFDDYITMLASIRGGE